MHGVPSGIQVSFFASVVSILSGGEPLYLIGDGRPISLFCLGYDDGAIHVEGTGHKGVGDRSRREVDNFIHRVRGRGVLAESSLLRG